MTDRRPGDTLTAAQLEVGDIVRLAGDAIHAFDDTVVKAIHPNTYYPTHADLIVLARPYAVLTDYTTTAGVGVSIGVEEYTVARDASTRFELRRASNVGQHGQAVEAERKAKDAEIARLKAERNAANDARLLAEEQRRAAEAEALRIENSRTDLAKELNQLRHAVQLLGQAGVRS